MLLAFLTSFAVYPQKKLVVLGSSTSACWGPSTPANCYVNRLASYYNTPSPTISIDNRAVAGFNVYRSMPRGFKPPAGRDTSFPYYSITDALAANPDVILVNYPSNNYDIFSVAEVMFCLRTIKTEAARAGKPCYISTTQPRTGFDAAGRERLRIIKDSILFQFGHAAIDFWTGIADPVTLSIALPYQVPGDLIHLNDQAHSILYQRVVEKKIFQPALADAGRDINLTLPYAANLNGTNSMALGGISSYNWTKVSGPAAFYLVSPAASTSFLNSLVAGAYTFRLTITDFKGNTSSDDVVVSVQGNTSPEAPVANAGKDETIPTGQSTVLDGRSSYTNSGSIVSYKWVKYAGPTTYDILNPSEPQTWIRNMTAGTYVYRLTVTSSNGLTGFDDVTIIVSENTLNTTTGLVANAGKDETLALGQSTVLHGENSIAYSGAIKSYSWSKISGPASYQIASPGESTTWIRNMEPGSYVYRLTITDFNNGTAYDDVVIHVSSLYTYANAGKDETISVGQSTVLHGESSYSTDGTISRYSWAKVSGPSAYDMLTPNASYTWVRNMVAGSYTYRLTVTDDKGRTASDDVVITVIAAGYANAEKHAMLLSERQDRSSLQQLNLTIYPNPVIHQAWLEISNGLRGEGRIYITDALGNLVKSLPVTKDQQHLKRQIPLGELKQGLYTVTLSIGNESKTSGKFFKY